MQKKKFTKTKASSRRPQKDPLPWKYFLVTIFFAVLLAAGFFHAARLHFFSLEYGASNHKLRVEIEDLKAKTRKLKLNKELAMSPAEIKEAAGKLGLTRTTVFNLEPLGDGMEPELASLQTEESAVPAPVKAFAKERAVESRPVSGSQTAATAPKVVKTVKASKSVPVAEKPEPQEDPTKLTRSRIIDTTAKR